MNKEHKQYYIYLEQLRRSGVCNMFGASIYLEKEFDLDRKEARTILSEWMEHYDEIMKELF